MRQHAMTYEEWNASDDFKLELFITSAEAAKEERALEVLLDVLERQQGFLTLERVSTRGRAVPYSRAQAYKLLARMSDSHQSLWLESAGPPGLEVKLHWHPHQWVRLQVSLHLRPLAFLRQEDSHLERSAQLLTLVRALCDALPVVYGFGHSATDLSLLPPFFPESPEGLIPPPFICWLNVLGRDCVDALGRERVLSLPEQHLVEPLRGDSVLFLTRPSLLDFDTPAARHAQARALCHLRPELSLEDTVHSLLQRSLAFQPLAPAFPPDVAPLFHHLLSDTPLQHRHQLTESFNGFHPEPISECLPASEAFAYDVPRPEATLVLYESFYAERLGALLQKDIPDFAQTPDSLPQLDAFTEKGELAFMNPHFVEEDLVPMLGAHLGLLLVNHLGGTWVPRQRLDEAQVMVGSTAWLPFLRARHLVEALRRCDEQALARCSLTQLYQVAARQAAAAP